VSNPNAQPALNWLPRLQAPLGQLCATNLVPCGVAIGWIQVESSGRLAETTNLDERGYFQLLPEESRDLGLDHQRLSTDSDYSLQSGFMLIEYYRHAHRRMCDANNITCVLPMTEYYWRMIKFAHSMGQGSVGAFLRDAAAVGAANDWPSLCAYLTANDARYLHQLKHSPVKWIGLINRMFAIGQPYGIS
jgi:hypothetical protein